MIFYCTRDECLLGPEDDARNNTMQCLYREGQADGSAKLRCNARPYVGSPVNSPASWSIHAMFFDPRREMLHKLLKPFQYEFLLDTLRPPDPPTAFLV